LAALLPTLVLRFGFQSRAAPAIGVDVLVEGPVMLSVVQIIRRSRGWHERRDALS
jgi:ACR3 family arsenite transporter